MSTRKGLGRGLEALIGEQPTYAPQENAVQTSPHVLPISAIDNNSAQPRKYFNEEALQDLAQSIRQFGVLQPVVVRHGEVDGRYRLIAGERRWRASQIAGLQEIPVVIVDVTPRESMEMALVENIQRQDLNPIETAVALQELLDTHQLTQEALSERVGLSRPALTNTLRLLQLPLTVRDMVAAGELSAGHGRTLLPLMPNHNAVLQLAQRSVQEGLSVRTLEKMVASYQHAPIVPTKTKPQTLPDLIPLIDALTKKLGTKVKVQGNLQRGTVTIRYFNSDDLERLYALVAQED